MLRREQALLEDVLWNNVTGRKNELLDREMKACVIVADKINTIQQLTRDAFTELVIVSVKTKGGSRRKQTRTTRPW
jgi:hypothetical protein